MYSMASISLCMIARDEEGFIRKSLGSVAGFVSEIILVDSGSTDRTAEMARELGAKVFDYEWDGSFSSVRNFSISKAAGDWILVLDADETISRKDLERIGQLVESGEWDGISLVQRNYTDNEFLRGFVSCENDVYEESRGFKGYDAVPVVRVFRNDKRISYRRKVHEVVEHSIMEFGGRILRTDIPIHHFKELKKEGVERQKEERYGKLSAEESRAAPKDSKAYFDRGYFFFRKGDFRKAAKLYKKAIERNRSFVDPYFGLVETYVEMKEYKKAIEVTLRVLGISPGLPAAYFNLGELYAGTGEYGKAIEAYEKALQLGSPQKQRIMEVLAELKAAPGGSSVTYSYG